MKKASAMRSSPAAKGSKKKAAGSSKVATPRKGVTTPKKGHPTFAAMICEAIADIEGTVSRPAIAKWIKDHYTVNEAQFALHLKNGLAKAEDEGKIVKVKASYKLKAMKRSKDDATTRKAAAKRKITTPKAKKLAKKRRTEKESESEGPEEEEDEEEHNEEEEQSSHEMESREGTADEESYETDVGPMEDITAEKSSAEPEAGSHSEPADDAVVASAPGQDESNGPGRTQRVAEQSEPTLEDAIERSGKAKAAKGTVEAEPLVDAQENVEPSQESDTFVKAADSSFEATKAVDKPELSVDSANDNEASEADAERTEPGEDKAETIQQVVAQPKVSEVITPNEDGTADFPPSNPGDGEIATEATEQDANAAVVSSVPVVQESESAAPAEKSASISGAGDPMAVETL